MNLKKLTEWVVGTKARLLYLRLFALLLIVDFQVFVWMAWDLYHKTGTIEIGIAEMVLAMLNIVILGTLGYNMYSGSRLSQTVKRKVDGWLDNEEVKDQPKAEERKGRNRLVEVAQQYVGVVKERMGNAIHPKIKEWLQTTGFGKKFGITDDAVPWCATGTSGCCIEASLPFAESPRAKAFGSVGREITPKEARDILVNGHDKNYGIVAILHRGYISPQKYEGSGHVAIVKSIEENLIDYGTIEFNVNDSTVEMKRKADDPKFIEFRIIE